MACQHCFVLLLTTFFSVIKLLIIWQHDGWVDLSDVEGMIAKDASGNNKTINDVGKVKIKTCTKKVHTQEGGAVYPIFFSSIY